jgi:hypothetical protein
MVNRESISIQRRQQGFGGPDEPGAASLDMDKDAADGEEPAIGYRHKKGSSDKGGEEMILKKVILVAFLFSVLSIISWPTIDTCIINVLYSDPEGIDETIRKRRVPGKATPAGRGVLGSRTPARGDSTQGWG